MKDGCGNEEKIYFQVIFFFSSCRLVTKQLKRFEPYALETVVFGI